MENLIKLMLWLAVGGFLLLLARKAREISKIRRCMRSHYELYRKKEDER